MRPLVAVFALLIALCVAGRAEAYPHFQFSSDTSACSMCHYAPAGGGMLTGWGRMEAGDTLSRGGDGAALHGAIELPEWLQLGGDFRLAGFQKDTGESEASKPRFFPMQADLAARVAKGPLSIVASVGLRGKARPSTPPSSSRREEEGFASFIVSREHYIAYKGEDSKLMMRAGRFYAPYGLRLPDHTSYIRRYLGFNMLQETYNLSGSYLKSKSETHVSAHVSDPLLGPEDPSFGGTAMYEARGESRALGGSLRVTQGPSDLRAFYGGHYKKWLEGQKLLLMAELDLGYQRFDDAANTDRFQLAAYAGPVWFPTDGLSASIGYELFDEDLLVKYVERQAVTSWVSFLPRAHYEIFLMGRAARIGPQERVYTAMMQLHYYL